MSGSTTRIDKQPSRHQIDKYALRDEIRRLEESSRALDPDSNERREILEAVHATSERYLAGLEPGRAYIETQGRAAGLLNLPITEEGNDLSELITLLEQEVIRPGGHPAAPGHLAYLTGGGLYHSALADYLGAVTNKYAGIFFTGHGPVRMENMLVRWVADLVGYPATAAGSIASGGSIANLTAVTTARDAHCIKGEDIRRAVAYLTGQTHHCIEKALRIAGLEDVEIRHIATDERYRMRVDALAETISRDREDGLRPWLIVATAGTTDTGAVDPLDDLAAVAEREQCWFHVDAAYGGFFLLTDDGKKVMKGIERSDSVVLDPHKSLFLPWGAGIVVLRDRDQLVATHRYSGHYLQDAFEDPSAVSPSDVSPELTKPFRALRMWLPLMLVGAKPFRDALNEKLMLARYFHQEVATVGYEVGPPPDLSTVIFRWAPDGTSVEEANRLNEQIVTNLRLDGRIFLSSTTVDGRFMLRIAALSFRTHLSIIDLALEVLAQQATHLDGPHPYRPV